METLIFQMPKIELHAHLNGSLTTEILGKLAEKKFGLNSNELSIYKQKINNFTNFKSDNLSECFEIFKIAHDLLTTLELVDLATNLVIEEFVKQNTIYLELRTTPKKCDDFSKEQYLETIIQSIKNMKEKYPSILVKLIPSFDRKRGINDAEDSLNTILNLKRKYPDIICGLDLSGDPLAGKFSDFIPLLKKAKSFGLKLALHCAEVDNIEDETKEMIEFGMERLGHGTFLKDNMLDLIKEKNICIECCLTSNIKCGTVKKYSDHHFNEMFVKHQVPVVICTDDLGVFDTNISKEFLIASESFNLKVEDLIKISLYGVEHCFANEDEKLMLKNKISLFFQDH